MNAGALNFTLGLQANQFLNSLGIASGKLAGFLGITAGIQSAFHKMWAAIEQGGNLKDLADASSLSVKSLYQLQEAFKQVGSSADSVPTIINRLRRTLGSGEQDGLLAGIGLDPAALKAVDPAKQFEAIAAALAKLNVNARSQGASAIFGREGAKTILQIANSGKDFAEAMKDAAGDASIWSKVAEPFDSISDKIVEIEGHINTMTALLTGTLVQAFEDGRLMESLFDIFSGVFEAVGAALPGLLAGGFVKLGELLLRVLTVPLTAVQTYYDKIIGELYEKLSKVPGLRDALGLQSGFKAGSWSELYQNNKANGLDFYGASLDDISKYAASMTAGGLQAGLQKLIELRDRMAAGLTGSGVTLSGGDVGGIGLSTSKITPTEVTNIEKMGAVIGGLGRGFGGDEARRTADNTKRSADSLRRIEDKLGAGTSDFSNRD